MRLGFNISNGTADKVVRVGKGVFVGKTLFLDSREIENTCGFVKMTSDSVWGGVAKHHFPSQSPTGSARVSPDTRLEKSAAVHLRNRLP